MQKLFEKRIVWGVIVPLHGKKRGKPFALPDDPHEYELDKDHSWITRRRIDGHDVLLVFSCHSLSEAIEQAKKAFVAFESCTQIFELDEIYYPESPATSHQSRFTP